MEQKVSFEAASETLRLALPLMSRHRVPIVPPNYAVWYAYVTATHEQLKSSIDRLIETGETVDERATRELYRQYLESPDSAQARSAESGIRQLLGALLSTLAEADSDVSRYGEALQQCATRLEQDAVSGEELHGLVAGLIERTREMHAGNARLHEHLEQSVEEAETLRRALEQARLEAMTDPLTGLANRKGFDERLATLRAEPDFAQHPHSLLIGDVDNFKSINDSYGHLFGDKILKVVAKVFANLTKGQDLAARFGGEEFIILLPRTDLKGATALAESIRSSIERGRVYNPKTGAEIRRVTISVGVAELVPDESVDETIARADAALYRAKQAGRNRVEVAAAGEPETAALATG